MAKEKSNQLRLRQIPLKHLLANRKRFIFELGNVPADIKRWHKSNKKLTKTEKRVSALLQVCIRYGYVTKYTTQQIIMLGESGKYIMSDFFLSYPEVIIEVDGPEHDPVRDGYRDKEVKRLFAYDTIRITNNDLVRNNLKTCRKIIEKLAKFSGLTSRQASRRGRDYLKKRKDGV